MLIAEAVSDYTESMALAHHSDSVDIYSCSWGPMDDAKNLVGPGRLMKMTLERGVRNGRGKKGNIFMWAGGNGRQHNDNCNYDGYANSRFTFAIGAIDKDGQQSWYSEPCAALIGVTPSSGSRKGITTTDITGSGGYVSGECTDGFGGTSSACPLAAGVVALMLEARPELTWRDVQHVIAKHAVQVDTGLISSGDWNTNERGFHHSHRYGFGLLRAPDLVDGAKSHALVPPQKGYSQVANIRRREIPNNGGHLSVPISIRGSGISFIEHVTLEVRANHPRRGELGIRVRSPEGVVSVLAERRSDTHAGVNWTFFTIRHFGEQQADGKWHVELEDLSPHNSYHGRIDYLKINIYGY